MIINAQSIVQSMIGEYTRVPTRIDNVSLALRPIPENNRQTLHSASHLLPAKIIRLSITFQYVYNASHWTKHAIQAKIFMRTEVMQFVIQPAGVTRNEMSSAMKFQFQYTLICTDPKEDTRCLNSVAVLPTFRLKSVLTSGRYLDQKVDGLGAKGLKNLDYTIAVSRTTNLVTSHSRLQLRHKRSAS